MKRITIEFEMQSGSGAFAQMRRIREEAQRLGLTDVVTYARTDKRLTVITSQESMDALFTTVKEGGPEA